MDAVFSLEKWSGHRTKRELQLCIPTRMGQEIWHVTLDRRTGVGQVSRVWTDQDAKAAANEGRRLEAEIGFLERSAESDPRAYTILKILP